MKVIINFLTIIFVLQFLFSCKKDENTDYTQDETLQFNYFQLENKGWKSRKHAVKIDDIKFTATEVPVQYYILREFGEDNLSLVDSVYNESKTERIIEFTFEHETAPDLLEEQFTQLDYESSVKYASFTIAKDFFLITSKNDTIHCSGVIHERNFKTAPYLKTLLFFENIAPDDKVQLLYLDKLFHKGILKFQFIDSPLIL